MYNPSLRREPRYEPASVISLKKDPSLIDWLAANNRLIFRDREDKEDTLDEDLEMSELMDVDDSIYDDDDDDIELDDD